MNPLITILIPAYNGESFLDFSIHSLINNRLIDEKVYDLYEIIIVNDGSTDNTQIKAESLAKIWNHKIRPDFIRVINKENGQYGSVINLGIKEAKGTYFKVLDCDDTFNVSSFIDVLYSLLSIEKKVDVVFTDFTFEKVGSNEKITNSLRKYFEPYKILDLTKQRLPSDLMTMHGYIYRTNFLRDIKYKQLEGVYYSDSQYALIPLVKAKTMYYINKPLYRYYIGREEQSINVNSMIKNKSHQRAVLETIFQEINLDKIKSTFSRDYALLVLRQMMHWHTMIIALDKSVKNKPHELMNFIKDTRNLQPKNYKKIEKGALFFVIKITRGHFISKIIKVGIKIYSKFKKNIMAEWD